MFRSRTLIFTTMLLVAASLHAASKAEKIDQYINRYNKLRQFNGSALVADGGKIVLEKGYGFANFEWDIPNTPDTKFRLASITKQFTSMVIMQFAGEGKIKLDEKITTYLSDYRKDTGDRVTIRHLLNHTSGIPNYTSLPGFENTQRNHYAVSDFVKKFASGDLEFEPGSQFNYSNSGYFLLGAIIERLAGKSYDAVLQERIFGPLGMKSSGYDVSETVLKKRASGYELRPDGYVNAQFIDMSVPFAAGGLYSTVGDLYRWDQALYGNDLLRGDLKAEMFKPGLRNYGFGWSMVKTRLHDKKTVIETLRHGGGIDGFHTLLVRVPERRALVVLLDNTARGDTRDELAAGILTILYDGEPNPPRPSIADAVMPSIEKDGMAKAVARYRTLRETRSNEYTFAEADLNGVGNHLLSKGRIDDAIEIFKLNAETYPESFDAYDSLAAAYVAAGGRDLAIENYRRSVRLNPKNVSGLEALKRLDSAPSAPYKLTNVSRYLGRYELAPNFMMTIGSDGDGLTAQATNQQRSHLIAVSDSEFSVKEIRAIIRFELKGDAPAPSFTLYQNGHQTKAKRVESSSAN
jgi:CubicO group peptidase (beta-lactamase class C family)